MCRTNGDGGQAAMLACAAADCAEQECEIFPGARLCFHCYSKKPRVCRHSADATQLEIEYCHAGRAGWHLRDGTVIYLGAGDCVIHRKDRCAGAAMSFPNESYTGLTLALDPARLALEGPEILRKIGWHAEKMDQKFCADGKFTLIPGNEQTKPIFAGLFNTTPEREAWRYLKTLELLLYLYQTQHGISQEPNRYQAEQIALIRQVHDFLTEHLDQRVTIESLSKQFLMNASALKALFKAVYGNSIAAHIKEHRMERAAALLRETDDSIAEVARAVGYESQSKFSGEFRKMFQMLPSEYRKTHR